MVFNCMDLLVAQTLNLFREHNRKTMPRAPWYVRNENIHKELQIPFVKDEFKRA